MTVPISIAARAPPPAVGTFRSLHNHDSKIMFSMLQVILGRDGVAQGYCVTRKRLIFFEQLCCIATNFYIGTIALYGMA